MACASKIYQRLTIGMIISLSMLISVLSALESTPSTLSVIGQATLYKPADELHIDLGVVTQGETAAKALKKNNVTMREIIESLEVIGLKSSDYQTGRFAIQPIYSQPPKASPPDWQPEIVSYRVTNTIAIKTEKIELAGEILDKTTEAGANRIDNLWFGVKDSRSYRSEAIIKATAHAQADAQTLSNAANVRLQKILSLSLSPEQPVTILKQAPLMRTMAGESTPIQGGDVEISATVSIVYELADNQLPVPKSNS